MPRIPLDDDGLRLRLRLTLSPVAELFNSLHVLADPSHHLSNQAWAAGVRTLLADQAPDLLAELDDLGQRFDQWLGIADTLELADDAGMSVAGFLALLERLPAAQVVAALDTYAEEYASQTDVATNAEHQAARRDPAAFVARLLLALRRYWEMIFAAEWERRRPLLAQRRAQEAARLDQMEPPRWLATLHDRITFDAATESLVFHKAHDYRFPLSEIGQILCIPSTFSAPHLMIGYTRSGEGSGARLKLTIYINTAVSLAEPERIPPALLSVAKALADETRLRIYKAILKRPHYTQELAAALRLAEPTISRHLKLLRSAGLARSEKENGVVLYTGVLDPVDRLPAIMREFLRG